MRTSKKTQVKSHFQLRQMQEQTKRITLWVAAIPTLFAIFMYFDGLGLNKSKTIFEHRLDLTTLPDTQEVYLPTFTIPQKDKIYYWTISSALAKTKRNDLFVQVELCDTTGRPFNQLLGDFYYDYDSEGSEYFNSSYSYLYIDTIGTFKPRIVVEKTSSFLEANLAACDFHIKITEEGCVSEYYFWAMWIFGSLWFLIYLTFNHD